MSSNKSRFAAVSGAGDTSWQILVERTPDFTVNTSTNPELLQLDHPATDARTCGARRL